MIPVIGFAGKSGSGKTTVLAAVVRELKARGLRLAVIKHTRHAASSLDTPGKDTAVHFEAGADAVALATGAQVGMYMRVAEPWSVEEVARLFPDVDLVLVEGDHEAQIPKLWIMRRGVNEEMPDPHGLIGFITDLDPSTELPVFRFNDVGRIADLCNDYVRRLGPKRDVSLWVNGRRVMIKPFIKDFFLNTISAMVASLRDTEGAQRIEIRIEKPEGE